MFNCSTSTAVPEVIACDGVKHCVGDEDEGGCEYRQQGCGDWFPYQDQCLKIHVFSRRSVYLGETLVTFPLEAEKECRASYGASLPVLPDEEGIHIVAKLILHSGAVSAATNLHKVKTVSRKHEHMYRFLWQWGKRGSAVAYERTHIQKIGTMTDCAMLSILPRIQFLSVRCFLPSYFPSAYICMKPNPRYTDTDVNTMHGLRLTAATRSVHQFLTKQCEDGSVVQIFHHCLWVGKVLSTQWSPKHFPLFHCRYGPPVHYTLVCDGLQDCADGSDEAGCLFPQAVSDDVFICANHQAIPKTSQCDGIPHCLDNTDEQDCTFCKQSRCDGIGCVPDSYTHYLKHCSFVRKTHAQKQASNIGVPTLHLDGYGMSRIDHVSTSTAILEGYFRCSNGLYIPSFLLSNGEQDCPRGDDENIIRENFTCPGYYRCQYYGNCVHSVFVCDGVPHCPNKDDETYCNVTHPSNCTCEGFVCSCRSLPRPLSDVWYLRYLDVSGVKKPVLGEFFMLEFLQFLNVSSCLLDNVTLVDMPQLKILDMSYNALTGLSSMVMDSLVGLTHLNLSGNPFVSKLDSAFSSFVTQSGFIHIQHLVMVNTNVCEIEDYVLSVLPSLRSLDIRKNKLENYNKNVFGGLNSLNILQTDDSRLCCSHFHPRETDCHAPTDELSSCNDLLRLDFFRVFLWLFSLLATLGNCGVLFYKTVSRNHKTVTPNHILVSNLCVADLLMGINMMIIGAADIYFRGRYVANETKWRRSSVCIASGFVAFLSSEMSAFVISLITLDRMLVLCFPFRSHLHLSARSTMTLCSVVWGLGLFLAAVPFIGRFEFYGESSICLPLPITRRHFSGQMYAFMVFIVMNFLLFLFIGAGQLAIYWAVRRAKAAVNSKQQEEQSTIARRLFLVVFTDFCCWFPVGLMGILASCGVPIPGSVSVWVAVFVLPLNSVLNPFLYTLNSLKERWNIRKINQKSRRILYKLKDEIPKLPPSTVEEMIMIYLRSNEAVKLRKALELMSCKQQNKTDSEQGEDTLSTNQKPVTTIREQNARDDT